MASGVSVMGGICIVAGDVSAGKVIIIYNYFSLDKSDQHFDCEHYKNRSVRHMYNVRLQCA